MMNCFEPSFYCMYGNNSCLVINTYRYIMTLYIYMQWYFAGHLLKYKHSIKECTPLRGYQ
ncbi:hypothetical protein BDW72DRAFT_163716 [Aspergillus terricola var. indicus]